MAYDWSSGFGGGTGAWDDASSYQDTSGLNFSPYDQSLWYDPNQNYYGGIDWSEPNPSWVGATNPEQAGYVAPNYSGGFDWSSALGSLGNFASSPSTLAMLGGGLLSSVGAQQTGTQVSTQAPWEAQQPYLRDLFAKSQAALGGSLDMSAQEQSALNQMQQRAQMGSPLQAMGTGTAMGVLGGFDANPYYGMNNPFLTQSIDAASQDAMRNMMPYFAQQQRASGSFGNANLGESQARTAAETLGNISNQARMQDYSAQQQLGESDINRRVALAAQAPAMAQQDYADLERLYNIGQTRRYDPYATLGKYGSLIQGQYGGVTSSPIYQNRAAEALGGGLLGLQAYKEFSGAK